MISIVECSGNCRNELEELIYSFKNYNASIDPLHLNKVKPEFKKVYIDHLINDIQNRNGKIYMAIYKEHIVGAIVGIINEYNETVKSYYLGKKEGIVLELYVNEKYRKRGVATKLVNEIEKYFKINGCDEIRLDILATNQIARNFCIRRGFSERNINMIKKI